MTARRLGRALLGAAALTLLSTLARGSVVEYQGWDCAPGEAACPHPVAARGWPVPYVVDKESLSPTPNVDLVGALLGLDSFRAPRFLASAAFWLLVALGGDLLWRRRRARGGAPWTR